MNPTESKSKTGRSVTVSDGSEIIKTNSPKQQGVSLSVSGLRKSYNGIEVLKGIDFDVNPGEIFVIMGPSGSGKSVLLRQLIGLEEPDPGGDQSGKPPEAEQNHDEAKKDEEPVIDAEVVDEHQPA